MTKWLRLGALVIGLLLLLSFWAVLTKAQVQDSRWSAPYRLSSEGVRASDNHAVADPYGYVHLFWIEKGFPDERAIIQYARFDGETWSPSIDVYTTQPTGDIDLLSPTIDRQGNLHLIWAEGGTQHKRHIDYMYAPAHHALSAHHWIGPTRLDVLGSRVRVQVDSKNVVHVLYTRHDEPQPGVHYLRSEDQGATWSEPVWLDPDIPVGDFAPATLQFALDEADGLHAVWHYSPFGDRLVGGNWIRYAHSLDGGDTWSTPFTVDENEESGSLGAAGPVLTTQGQAVHVVWAGGELNYRNHRFSEDAGRTWTAPARQILGRLNGQAGDGLVTDGAGRVFFIGQIRSPTAIYTAYWDQGIWSRPSLVYLIRGGSSDLIGDRIHAHGLRSAVRAGNQLVITFRPPSSDEDGSLYTMHRTLDDIPPQEPIPTPTIKPTATAVSISKSTTVNAAPTATPRTRPVLPDAPIEEESSPSFPLAIAMVPTLGLILIAVFVKLFWRS